MAFELPKLVDLTDDQLMILNAAYDKNMIVGGAPGTGKSVLAIYRAADLSRQNKKTLLLVYNKPLRLYISSAVKSLGINTEVSTYHSWLNKFYKENISSDPPSIDFDWDFAKVIEDFKKVGYKYDNILIDEAQDFDKDLIKALSYVGKTINCFMDVNQRIKSNQYTRYQDIANILGINRKYSLTENFRNTEEIFEYAKLYCQDDNYVTTTRNGEKPLFVKAASEDEAYKTISKLILNNSTSTIGIFTNHGEQEEVYILSGVIITSSFLRHDNKVHEKALATLESLETEIQEDIKKGDYDSARIKINKIQPSVELDNSDTEILSIINILYKEPRLSFMISGVCYFYAAIYSSTDLSFFMPTTDAINSRAAESIALRSEASDSFSKIGLAFSIIVIDSLDSIIFLTQSISATDLLPR